MAQLTPAQFSQKWVPLLANNEFQNIDGPRLADFVTDIKDSFAVSMATANVPDWIAGTYYPLAYLILHSFGGPAIFLKASQAGYLPAPTAAAGDANWVPALGPVVADTYQLGTVAGLVQDQGKWVPGRLYILQNRVDARGDALPDVLVRALSPDRLEPEGYTLDTLAGTGPERVSYDLATDTAVPVDAYTKAATDALLASKANLDASGVLLASELPTGHVVLRHADGTCQFFSTLAFIRSQMRAGDTVELQGLLDNTGLDLQLPVPLTVYLAAGSDITLDKLRPASSGQTRICGPGTLRTVLNPGPLATDTLVQDISLVGSIYCYSYGGGVPGKLRLETVRGQSAAGFVAVEYGYSGFYHRYLQVELIGCTIEAGDNLVSFFDQAAGGASDAAAKAGNLLRVERCSLTAPAGKQLLDDTAGAATLVRGGNVYRGLSMPAQLDAQLLTADTDERRHSLAYASSVVLDFVAGSVQTIEPTGPLTLATANLAVGRQCRLHLFNSGSTDAALTFPAGWAWLGDMPTTLAAGKKATLALECAFGATDNDITAGYAAQS